MSSIQYTDMTFFDQKRIDLAQQFECSPFAASEILSADERNYIKMQVDHEKAVEYMPGNAEVALRKSAELESLLRSKVAPYLPPEAELKYSLIGIQRPLPPHVDSHISAGQVYIKQFVFPMTFAPTELHGEILFYDQRFYGCIRNPILANIDGAFQKERAEFICDYRTDSYPNLSQELSIFPKERMHGLSVQKTITYQLGDMVGFNSSQLHGSTNFRAKGLEYKNILLVIAFLRMPELVG